MSRALIACLSSAVLLSGCGTIFKDRSQVPVSPIGGFGTPAGSPDSTPPSAIVKQRWRNADRVTLDLPSLMELYARPGSAPDPAITFEQALADFSRLGPADAKRGRDDIVGAVLMASEKNCQVYLEYLHGNVAGIKAASSVTSTLLSGAAAVATPARSSRLLAGLATMATGAGGNLSEALFNGKTADVIASGVEAERATLKAKMRDDLKQPYDAYPLMVALSDAATYHSRCNAVSGLAYLQTSAQNVKTQAETGKSPGSSSSTTTTTTNTGAAGGAAAGSSSSTTTTTTPAATPPPAHP